MSLIPADAARLASQMQQGVPLTARPFHALAESLCLTPADVLEQLAAWRGDGTLREISAILEGDALGYESALVTAQVPGARLEAVAAVVGAHPTVTHNYERVHDYNLWFTLAVPEEMGVDRTLRLLEQAAGDVRFFPLRRTATFKISVRFNLESLENDSVAHRAAAPARFRPTSLERSLLRALQSPLPLVERPFAALAAAADATEDQLLTFANAHLGGAIRRYVGTLRHRKLGVRGNAMVVWRVADPRLAEVGSTLAAAPEVSHCYARTPIPGFPFNLYSMVHGPDEATVQDTIQRLADRIGNPEHRMLFSPREFKKCRLRYFLPELEQWWNERTSPRMPQAAVTSH